MSSDHKVRAAVRAQLLAEGVPPPHVDEIVDLGMHARDRAIDTLFEVTRRASISPVSLQALLVASGLVKASLTSLEEDASRFSRDSGLGESRVAKVSVS